jgi:hypothetical protein
MNVRTFVPPNGNAKDGVPWPASGAGRVARRVRTGLIEAAEQRHGRLDRGEPVEGNR